MDCPNGDDEKPPHCQNVTCRPDQFQCKDRSCIPGHLMCSGKAECADGSDEFNCSKLTTDTHNRKLIVPLFCIQQHQHENVTQKQSSTVVAACAYLIQKYAIQKLIVPTHKMNRLENVALMNVKFVMVDVHISVWIHQLLFIANVDLGNDF